MFKKLIVALGSTWLMAILFTLLALGMAIGTFVENDHSIDAARIYVYNAKWFETVMGLFVVNFFLSARKFGLHKKHNWPTLTIHLALVVIIIGAFITRYHGFTGLMSIREGATSNEVISDEAFLKVEIKNREGKQTQIQHIEKQLWLSGATPNLNDFSIQTLFNNKNITIGYVNFVENAACEVDKNESSDLVLKIVETKQGERHDHFIKEHELFRCGKTSYGFNSPEKGMFNFFSKNRGLELQTSFSGALLEMSSGTKSEIVAGGREVELKALYDFGSIKFVVPELPTAGRLALISGEPGNGADGINGLVLNLTSNAANKEVVVFGKKRKVGESKTFTLDGLTYTFSYGSKIHELPFHLKLLDFIAERYPGTTNSYSAFKSEVEVLDGQKNRKADIFMNHVLDYGGYRFFQSSFHPDESGTILSVNHDLWGTLVTYTGYFLLYFGLLSILFVKKSRFAQVVRKLKRLNAGAKQAGLVTLLLVSFQGFGQNDIDPMDPMVQKKLDSILLHYKVPEFHGPKFGRLIVQDANGRMKPMDTYASEVLRKVSKDYTYKELSANQTMLSMMQFPELWFNIPLVYLKRGNDSIRKLLGVPLEIQRVPLSKFFDTKGRYKMEDQVSVAYKSILPNQFEKDFIEVDRRVNLLHNVLRGEDLKLFPIPNDRNNTWVSYHQVNGLGLQKKDSLFISSILPLYFNTLSKEAISGNFQESYRLLEQIERYQIKFGHQVIPDSSKIELEILYNEYDIFKNLFSWYLSLGMLLLTTAIVGMFKKKRSYDYLLWLPRAGIYLCFVLQTIGLLARWYVSGHAPWSDAYESIIYISWATMLFGIVIAKKFDLALAATAFVNAIILMVAHWNWLDPAIANLQPVLNSYWLMIHVAIIVASYGPFTLGMVLSFLCLLAMAFLNRKNHNDLRKIILKLVLLTEITLTIGLVMLTIGNFLGGQWANESWGRYWAWDPKETWALISILVYAFIIHMRLVPQLNKKWLFSLMGILGFYSILMTYFGVNFYLSGLHSYAQGDNIVTPNFIYYSIGLVCTLAGISYFKQRRYPV